MTIQKLVWLRNDLRLEDNPALHYASINGKVRVVYILTIKQWEIHNVSKASIAFRLARVKELAKECGNLGIEFEVLQVDFFSQVPELLKAYSQTQNIDSIWFNKETPFDENKRDQEVKKALESISVKTHAQPYDLIVSQPVYNLAGGAFKVFTAYYKRWLIMLQNQSNTVLESPGSQGQKIINTTEIIDNNNYDFRVDLWPVETEEINKRFHRFAKKKIFDYESLRDFPNSPATSLLSPYLALGMIGPRQCLEKIRLSYEQSKSHANEQWLNDPWLRELTWRDYYRQLMIHFPHVSKNKDFKSNTQNIPWKNEGDEFKAWSEGQTGFPLIDAAMRQLNQTGWMHNRLRMLAASFLTKLLFIDWRKGEKYFMQTLIDAEHSANNGGWQWSASTGCDSAPYFRVFNPTRQSEKFDKTGEFIRKFVPELANINNKSIHNPTIEQRLSCDYPVPIVDYKMARVRAIELFKIHSL
jgi:deoxyribodipyrimidine photo-lyase